jgi:uncharacterized protein YndB with AHSA1/START domain
MNVDVRTRTLIHRPRSDVFRSATDPDNAPLWYENIKRVEWRSHPPLARGSRIAFVARFLGRELAYTYEVKQLEPDRLLVMATTDGPLEMQTTYQFEDAPSGTIMTLRNTGNATGFSRILSPFMSLAMRWANMKDLRRLKRLLEDGPSPALRNRRAP